MSSEEFPNRRPAIQTQRGRKRHKLGGTLQPLWASPRIGPPRSDTRPAAARQPKGEYHVGPRHSRRSSAAGLPETAHSLRPRPARVILQAQRLRHGDRGESPRRVGRRTHSGRAQGAGLRDPARDRRACPTSRPGSARRCWWAWRAAGSAGAARPGRPRSPMPSSSRSPVVSPKPGAAHDASPARREPTCRQRFATITTRPPPRCATTWSTPASCGGSARTAASGNRRDRLLEWQ